VEIVEIELYFEAAGAADMATLLRCTDFPRTLLLSLDGFEKCGQREYVQVQAFNTPGLRDSMPLGFEL
jgi:hypothetical protein